MHRDPADIAQDARNSLTASLGRVQLLRRQAERGEIDLAGLLIILIATEARLRQLTAEVDALEDAAAEAASAGRFATVRRAA